MRILHVASEMYPLAKTGGLGDVVAALPAAQVARGDAARVLLPGYPAVLSALGQSRRITGDPNLFGGGWGQVLEGRLEGVPFPVYVLECSQLFWRDGPLYLGPDGQDWPDNPQRFAALGWAAEQLAAGADSLWQPDIVHGHDWQSGMAFVFIRHRLPPPRQPGLVLTIHNLAFQGWFGAEVAGRLGLPPEGFNPGGYEFHGGVNFLKAGLAYADRITTVSRTYAAEIQTPDQGFGLDGLLRTRQSALRGIVNGVDYQIWNPATDPHLPQPYDIGDLAGKAAAKSALQERLGLGRAPWRPLFALVGRLTGHKGAHLLLKAIPALLAAGGQLAVLGTGEKDKEDGFRFAAAAHPGQVAAVLHFDETLAHLYQAGADVMLLPSLTEPCGLTQLYAMRYGTLPLVRRVGGLADTVINAEPEAVAAGTATGFSFNDPTPEALAGTLVWVADLYRDHSLWRQIQKTAMTQDFSWEKAAEAYDALYQELRPA